MNRIVKFLLLFSFIGLLSSSSSGQTEDIQRGVKKAEQGSNNNEQFLGGIFFADIITPKGWGCAETTYWEMNFEKDNDFSLFVLLKCKDKVDTMLSASGTWIQNVEGKIVVDHQVSKKSETMYLVYMNDLLFPLDENQMKLADTIPDFTFKRKQQ